MSLEHKALLLGAFFPVFTPFQVVAGPLCQLVGGKKLLSLNLFGMSALLLVLPTMARIPGPWAMSACLAGIGICQGVLVPAQGQLKRNWLPDGPERVWGQRIIGLGMRVGYPTAAAAVPWIANRFGWRAVPYALGGPMAVFSLVWHFFATESPEEDEEELAAAAEPVEDKKAAAGGEAPGTVAPPAAPAASAASSKPKEKEKEKLWSGESSAYLRSKGQWHAILQRII
jgi:MFS family permease